MKTKTLFAAFLALQPLSSLAAEAVPAGVDILKSAVRPPAVSYRGKMTVTRWYGRQARADEAKVYYKPPDRYRWEFLRPDGSVKRVIVSDGDKESVYLIKQRQILTGDAAKSLERVMSDDRELELLLKNYELSAPEEAEVAGRPAWAIELSPLAKGKAHQKIRVDKETRVILEAERFQPHGASSQGGAAAVSRFTRFETDVDLPETLFRLQADSQTKVEEHGLDPDFLSMKDLRSPAPEELPGGFYFESGDSISVQGRSVLHLRYTDGLTVLSVFQTDRPVKLPKGGRLEMPASGPSNSLRLSSSGRVLRRKSGRRHYTLIGDLPAKLLESIAAELK